MPASAWKIVDLRVYPQWLDEVVGWHHSEWLRHVNVKSMSAVDIAHALMERQRIMQQHLFHSPIPSTFIAVQDGKPVGSVSLIHYRVSREPTRVWLTNLYIEPGYRQQGKGSALLDYAELFALRQELSLLYLYTFDSSDFYLERGWEIERVAQLRNLPIDILHKQL